MSHCLPLGVGGVGRSASPSIVALTRTLVRAGDRRGAAMRRLVMEAGIMVADIRA